MCRRHCGSMLNLRDWSAGVVAMCDVEDLSAVMVSDDQEG